MEGAPPAVVVSADIGGLFELCLQELRAIAARRLRHDADPTLQPTALVNELFVRLADGGVLSIADRAHFLAIAARAMRAILVDRARSRLADKRGASVTVSLADIDPPAPEGRVDAVLLETALARLASLDPRQARMVELRYFGGLTIPETADVLGISEMTVKRDWQVARAWLRRELAGGVAAPA